MAGAPLSAASFHLIPSLGFVLVEITSSACNLAGRADLIPNKRDTGAQPPITAELGPRLSMAQQGFPEPGELL